MNKRFFPKRIRFTRVFLFICLSFIFLLAAAILAPACKRSAGLSGGSAPTLVPIDPQNWQDQQEMTWDDYHPIPGVNWADPSLVPTRKFRVALVAVDFPDQPFVITLPKKSDLFGNPQIDPIPRAKVPQFYADFFGEPGTLNHGHALNDYFMEQSRGKLGIMIEAYGPYRMPKNLFQYGLNEWNQQVGCPPGFTCDGNVESDCDALWRAAAGQKIKSNFDIVLRIYAGYDETAVWLEFGEMKFQSRDDIPKEWGNPDPTKPRWVPTRFVPWTSWKAGQEKWGQSSIRQGENSGTIEHEIFHLSFKIGDNNNNQYVPPYRRASGGSWDNMDRGSFNGPGGTHMRWVVPVIMGGSMPSGVMLRNKIRLGWLPESNVLKINRDGLASSGLAVATVTARAVDPGPTGLSGITVTLDGGEPQDKTPPCDMNTDPLCPGPSVFNFYSLEVVQRIGYDSFTADNGILIAKNKNGEGATCGYNCFTWVIDAHPEDINMIDYRRPDGTPVMRTVADYRQLNDALFHAGFDSGSQYEWEDTANRLHFYVIDVHKDTNGVLSYTVGVRSLDGSGPQMRGVSVAPPASQAVPELYTDCNFTLTNTGAAAATDASLHPQDATAYLNNDVYRLSASVDGQGWSVQLRNALVSVKFGDLVQVPVYVTRVPGSAASATVTLKAVSESDSTKTATATCVVSVSKPAAR